jgi:hypothetical protein
MSSVSAAISHVFIVSPLVADLIGAMEHNNMRAPNRIGQLNGFVSDKQHLWQKLSRFCGTIFEGNTCSMEIPPLL